MQKSADAFRTISEVADDLSLPQHVLRFWETRFPQIRPLKRAGGRRYYRPNDILLLKAIRQLLYDDGYTIKGVQKLLKEQGARALASEGRAGPDEDAALAGEDAAIEGAAEPTELPAPPEDVTNMSLSHRRIVETALATIEECCRILETVRRTAS